jgi:phosphate transport system permease protein
MNLLPLLMLVAALAAASFWLARQRAASTVGGRIGELHSLPGYHGFYAALWCGLPGLAVALLWGLGAGALLDQLTIAGLPGGIPAEMDPALFLNEVRNLAEGNVSSGMGGDVASQAAEHYAALRSRGGAAALALGALLSLAGAAYALRSIRPELRARARVERVLTGILMASSTLAILVTIGIVLSLVFETLRFFQLVPVSDFLFGTHWSPQIALREGQVASSGSFGAIPIFVGTLLITAIAMSVAAPVGLFAAIYMTFYATDRFRDISKPLLEILAGIPTVVYGFFAALTVAPWIRELGGSLGLTVASESALAAGLVMGIMIIPFISSLSDDAITAVPNSLRDGAYGLGATRSETIRQVIIPAALPGIVSGFLLAISRAIGETMIVVMAAGLAANLSINPLEAVTTVTVQIVTLLTGDQEFDSAKTLAAFALGLGLFFATLILNVIALQIVQRYRERYD